MRTLRELLQKGKELLLQAGIENGAQDAWLLMEHVFGISRSAYFLRETETVSDEQEEAYLALVRKRMEHIPLQQLTHEAYFYGLCFYVNDQVLTPRQDTECLVEEALSHMEREGKILDMCTGSGCILLTLLHERPGYTGVGVDVSPTALEVAKKNAESLGIQASFIESNLFDRIDGTYDIIVSNPPYIASEEIPKLMEEVRDHEPHLALDGKEDGLYFYREIIKQAGSYLKNGGWLCFEIGYDQGVAVKCLLEDAGYEQTAVIQDLAGLDRVVVGRRI